MTTRFDALRIYYAYRATAPFFFSLWLTVSMLYHATQITSDPLQLVFIGVVLESATLFFEIPTGLIADVYSRKLSIVIGQVLWGIGFLIEGLLPVYSAILLSQLIWGLGFTFVSGSTEAWLVDEIGQENATIALVKGTQIGQASSLIGVIVGPLIGMIALALPIILAGVGMLIIGILLFIFMPETGFSPIHQKENRSPFAVFDTFRAGLSEVRGHIILRSVIFIGIIIGLSVGGFDRLYTPHLVQNFTMPLFEPVIWFGIMNAGVMIFTIIILEIIRRRISGKIQTPVTVILAWLAAGTVIGNLVFVWSEQFLLALIAFWFSQTMRTATKPLFMAWINQHATSQVRATVISMYWQSNAFGNIIGAPIIGWIGSLSYLRLALTLTSLALSPVILIYRRHRPHTHEIIS